MRASLVSFFLFLAVGPAAALRITNSAGFDPEKQWNPDIKFTEAPHCCTQEKNGEFGEANMKHTGEPIPNIVFTMGPFKPDEIEEANKKMFPPGTEFRFYNHNDLYPEIKKISEHLEKEVNITGAAEAFTKFRAHSYQSDLWRPMMLWEYGGYYLDAKIKLTAPIETWVDRHNDVFAVCRDLQMDREKYPTQPDYWSAMLAAPKRSPMVLPIIEKLIYNANNKIYPNVGAHNTLGKLYVAGPGAFTDALHEKDFKPAVRCENFEHTIKDLHGNDIAISDEEIHTGMRTCEDCDAYGRLFKAGQAYCEDPGPECRKYE